MNIRDHELACRWTQEQYSALPAAILDQLMPLAHSDAQLQHEKSLAYLGVDGLSPEYDVVCASTSEMSYQQGVEWLLGRAVFPDEMVSLSWAPRVALATTWSVFANYWQHFCYPASDDLVVFPANGDWVLLYHHEQAFHFGTRTEMPVPAPTNQERSAG